MEDKIIIANLLTRVRHLKDLIETRKEVSETLSEIFPKDVEFYKNRSSAYEATLKHLKELFPELAEEE